MNKTLKTLSCSILILTFLCLFAFSVRHVFSGGERLGFLTEPLKAFSGFPKTVYNVLTSREIKGISLTYTLKDTTYDEMNKINYDVFGLNSFYDNEKDQWEIKLFNFRDDVVHYSWILQKNDYYETKGRLFKNARIKNPILLPNRSLIAVCVETKNLYCLDAESNIVWHNTSKNFHHALNLSPDSNVWACTSEYRAFILDKRRPENIYYRDDFLTKIDVQTGEILYDKSISDILIENEHENFLYGFSNTVDPLDKIDPLHLNDIQPVYTNGLFWKKGDVFLSLRHKSLIIHYRPRTNKIIRMVHGPFLFQHDVDIISDHEISIFNNNTTNIGKYNLEDHVKLSLQVKDTLAHSKIIVYNYKDSTFQTLYEEQFIREDIFSRTEGSYEFLSTGDICVESQNDAKVYIMNNDEILLKKQFHTNKEHLVHLPNWIRIYENINF